MQKKERFRRFIEYFTEHFPEPQTELNFSNPYELLVAVILSAQCTDKRINQITPALFARFPEPESLAAASADEIFTYIRSVSYPNNKARHLAGMGRMLMERFGGEVPGSLEELQQLPGVGRKTANVILSIVYNLPTMAVDTHVFRVSHRLGLAPLTATTPLAVEKALMAYIPKQHVPRAHHWLILHGRYICLARSPKCDACPLKDFCKYYEKLTGKARVSVM
ncbi:endonuclease III [Arsenicibacter rosenii]|uniref:Endonuclease III n=1 Tax=Arsenicibacter rosenii TaxID=1750698 RepID=A0A1S2VNV3_9BACT|nr:endonuclease III [Arsenicibacter rosenii]OIN60457.1 endonuclease III [Arsenicibacter rosenii]